MIRCYLFILLYMLLVSCPAVSYDDERTGLLAWFAWRQGVPAQQRVPACRRLPLMPLLLRRNVCLCRPLALPRLCRLPRALWFVWQVHPSMS